MKYNTTPNIYFNLINNPKILYFIYQCFTNDSTNDNVLNVFLNLENGYSLFKSTFLNLSKQWTALSNTKFSVSHCAKI